MRTGDIVIASFPFTNLNSFKARPAVVVNVFPENYNDAIICLVSSVIPTRLTFHSILLKPDNINNLKTISVIRIARIATVEQAKINGVIGKLNERQLDEFINKFKSLIEVTK